ncbi:hyaluronoglucosaminidase [Saccharopolyspora lacisalsi]|uniref:Hyaluronoglucosaminidase n=1 Tax=Halosaccharopolyspora lacisalsi TaxID=1000566 RepID=A0A839E086_9PSEU|nr:beta-N-acetylglucosaminidase domain-containing protein [Halosaccharopolyspora lacisalsi]MBA8826693.1 hyaluronoglucosaminidase [Halosaccharopolyspora lacisalsi]
MARSHRGRSMVLASLLCTLLAATACTNTAPPERGGSTSGAEAHDAGMPGVTPKPRMMVDLGRDIRVHGKVAVVVDPLVDPSTRELAVRVLRVAGADEVIVREPGPTVEGVTLRVRLGDRVRPGIVKGLQRVGFGAPRPLEPEGYVVAAKGGDEPTLLLGASDSDGAYYAVQTLRQLVTPGGIAGVGIVDHPALPVRGTIEGFYGSPWTHAERMDQLAFYGAVKFNTYVYAPKDDPYHRERWRDSYPKAKLAQLRELIGQAAAHHVDFTFALSPGTSICYSDPSDWDALVAKMQQMYDAGVRSFALPLDDITYTRWNCAADRRAYGAPSPGAAGRAQVDLLNRLQHEFVDTHPGTRPLQMVPTEYSDVEDSAYKSALRERLDPRVRVMWTGDGVIPGDVTVDKAKQATEVWGREVMLWDNYPVNDFDASEGRLMVGPYAEREPGLSEHLSGLVVNPMNQAAASEVVEIGAAAFAWNDEEFDPRRAWRAAAEYLSGDRLTDGGDLRPDPATVEALMVFFDLNHAAPLADGDLWLRSAPELSRRLDEFRAAWNSGDRAKALADLRGYAQRIADAPERIRAGAAQDFVADAKPWLRATDLWGDALLATLDGLRARLDGGSARAEERFAAAAELARRAGAVRTIPGESRPQGPVKVAEGVLDTFVRRAPEM